SARAWSRARRRALICSLPATGAPDGGSRLRPARSLRAVVVGWRLAIRVGHVLDLDALRRIGEMLGLDTHVKTARRLVADAPRVGRHDMVVDRGATSSAVHVAWWDRPFARTVVASLVVHHPRFGRTVSHAPPTSTRNAFSSVASGRGSGGGPTVNGLDPDGSG